MTIRLANFVKETTTSTGTGNLTLSNATGFQSFNSAFGNGSTTNVFHYFIVDATNGAWEYGTGHMSAATTLVRDTVINSSNSNNAVNFSAGTKTVVNDLPASNHIDGIGAALALPYAWT